MTLPQNAECTAAGAPPRNRHRQNPEAGTTTVRFGRSQPTAATRRSSRRARRVSSTSNVGVPGTGDTSSGGRLSHGEPPNAAAIGDAGAPVAYHSSTGGVGGGPRGPDRRGTVGGPRTTAGPGWGPGG